MVLVSHLLLLAKGLCCSRWSAQDWNSNIAFQMPAATTTFPENTNYNSLAKIRYMLIRPLKISNSMQIENRCLRLQSVLLGLGTYSSHNLLCHLPRATASLKHSSSTDHRAAAPVPCTHLFCARPLCGFPVIISGILLLFSLVRCQTLTICNSGPEANPVSILKFACNQCKPQATTVDRLQILPLGWKQLSVDVLLGQSMHVNGAAGSEDEHWHCLKMLDGVGSMMQVEPTFSHLFHHWKSTARTLLIIF